METIRVVTLEIGGPEWTILPNVIHGGTCVVTKPVCPIATRPIGITTVSGRRIRTFV